MYVGAVILCCERRFVVRECELQMQHALADLRATEAAIETQRVYHTEQTDRVSAVPGHERRDSEPVDLLSESGKDARQRAADGQDQADEHQDCRDDYEGNCRAKQAAFYCRTFVVAQPFHTAVGIKRPLGHTAHVAATISRIGRSCPRAGPP